MDWTAINRRLQDFWQAVGPEVRRVSPWQQSRRFPELTFVREDEVGSYKARKYLSLVPWMLEQGFKTVRLRGSSHSGNTPRLALELLRSGIRPCYKLEGREGPPVGNVLLSKLVLGTDYTTSEDESKPYDWEVPEGASCPAALRGSLGLVGSLVEQAVLFRRLPRDLYIDSGTGFSAATLIIGCGYFELPCRVRVVTMTKQSESDLTKCIEKLKPEFEAVLHCVAKESSWQLLRPPVGASFGSTPRAVFEEIRAMAQGEGLMVDPLYTAKLSLTYAQSRNPESEALLFVSGNERELLGFQRPLRDYLD